ncbi:MAG TPA: hypothetical protein VER55_10630, partial [Ardenticatenaceae bacterium]|nr:hypothetical protein [Ardenticatenaceae bacterium]
MSQEPIRVLSTIQFDDEQLARLRSVSPRIALQQRPANSEEELVAVLRDSPEIVVLYTGRRLPDWSVAPGLEWIQFHFAGIDSVDLSSLPPEVLVTTASGIHSVVMAEHTFALLLALRRQVPLMFDW